MIFELPVYPSDRVWDSRLPVMFVVQFRQTESFMQAFERFRDSPLVTQTDAPEEEIACYQATRTNFFGPLIDPLENSFGLRIFQMPNMHGDPVRHRFDGLRRQAVALKHRDSTIDVF